MLASLTKLVAKATNPHAEISDQARHSLNSIPFERSENYTLFNTKHTLHCVNIDGHQWQFYDTGPGRVTAPKIPLIMIPGTTGTAEVFFQQLLTLGLRGYRLISVTIPNTPTVKQFIKSLNRFLSFLAIDRFHLLGTSLGGYLSISYTAKHPLRVLSLVLTNAFISTQLFHDNAPLISSDFMPEFYLHRYITAALPTNRQLSIQMALATDFVLRQVNALCREQLAARLSLNFSKHEVSRIEYPQERITIIDTLDSSALDPAMREALYGLLSGARYCTMKYGGDFPYLANHMEYTMLLQVHLRRHSSITSTETVGRPIATSTQLSTELEEETIGVFDHRRQYHDAQKAGIFEDDDQKDGVYYGTDHSSMSSDGFDHHTEADKRKSLFYSKSNGTNGTNGTNSRDNMEIVDGQLGQETPRILGVSQSYSSEEMRNGVGIKSINTMNTMNTLQRVHHIEQEQPGVVTLPPVGSHTEDYMLTDDKKRQYLRDKRIKKKRYKEYLKRKKKAYRRHVQKQRERSGSGDEHNDKLSPKQESKKRRRKRKRRKKKRGRSRKRKHRSSKKRSRRRKTRRSEENKVDKMNQVEREKAKLRKYYEHKKMQQEMRQHIMDSMVSVQNNQDIVAPEPLPGAGRSRMRTIESAAASGYRPRPESGLNLAQMGFGADDLQRMRSTSTNSMVSPVSSYAPTPVSQTGSVAESDKTDNILKVGNDLISPKLSPVGVSPMDSNNLAVKKGKHRSEKSILEQLPIHSIAEEYSIAEDVVTPDMDPIRRKYSMESGDDDDDDELVHPDGDSQDRVRANRSSRPSGKHRSVRKSRTEKDQTPMELAASQSNHEKRPTTVGGHRYIPSYDSHISEHGLQLEFTESNEMEQPAMIGSRDRSQSYKPWNDRRRDPSYGSVGNLDGIEYMEVSEIQDWPMEGTDHENPNLEYGISVSSAGQPMIIGTRYRDDSVTPRAMGNLMPPSHHVVMESDDHVGDSIF